MKRPTISPGMSAICLAPSLLIFLALGGCSGDEAEMDDPQQNATELKEILNAELTIMKRNPTSAAVPMKTITDIMEAFKDAPFGEQQTTFDGLTTGCQELQQLCDASPKPAKLVAKVDELLKLAAKLPSPTDGEGRPPQPL